MSENEMTIRPIVKMGSARLSELDVKIDLEHLYHTAAYVPPWNDAGDLDTDLLNRIEWHDTHPPGEVAGRVVWCNELMGSGYLEAAILKAHFDSIECAAHIGWDDCRGGYSGWVVWHEDLGDDPQAYLSQCSSARTLRNETTGG
jgi:hypothetical protein